MIRAGRLPTLLMIVAGGLVATESAIAQTPQAIGVRDRAHLFSKEAVSDAHARLRKVYDQTKMQVAIETVESLEGKTPQALATANARSLKVHGLYVLLARKERKIAAEPSDQAKKVFTAARCEAIVQAFADGLRSNKADDGLARAVSAIVQDTGASNTNPPRTESPRLAASDPAGVYDNARIFTNEVALESDKLLKELEKHEGKWQAVVETIGSLDGREIKTVLEEHARTKEVRGLYVLISRDDKKFRVDRSKSAANVFTQDRIDAITRVLADSFKAGDFDQGLKSAVAEIRKSVDAKLVAAAVPAPAPKPVRPGVPAQPGPGSSPTPAPPSPEVQGRADRPILPGPGDPGPKLNTGPSESKLPTAKPVEKPAATPTPAPKASAGIPRPILFLLLAGAVVLGIFLIRKMFGGNSAPQRPMFVPSNAGPGNQPAPGFGPAVGGQPMGGNAGPMVGGQPNYGPGYAPPPPGGYPPGYAPPPQGSGMGGFVKGALGGAAGAVVGNMIYDQFGRPHPAHASEIHPGQAPPMMPGQGQAGNADGYHAENAAVGGWNAAEPSAPSNDWGGNAGGAEGGWDNPGDNQGGGDWGSPPEAAGQGDWGGAPASGEAGGEWGGDQDGGGGGDWGGTPDDGGGDWSGGDDPNAGGW